MTEHDREHFALLMDSLAAAYGAEATTGLKLGYWMGLKDLPLADVEASIGRALNERKFMPKPVELRELAGQMTAEQRAVLAWDALRKAIREHGTYASVNFDDPLINATVRSIGGWQQLGLQAQEEFEKWTSQKFTKTYASLMASGCPDDHLKHLAGKHEVDNGSNGHAIEPPRYVTTGLPAHRGDVLARLGRGQTQQQRLVEHREAMQ
jgi:hypothetical protein